MDTPGNSQAYGPDQRVLDVDVRGSALLSSAHINRGTAFTFAERQALGLVGLLPSGVVKMSGQLRRVYEQYRAQPDNLSKNLYLQSMRERNEVLFYRLLAEHIGEMLPIVYTPTIGEAIEKFSHWYSRPHGVFLDIEHPEQIEESFDNYGRGADDVDIVCVTDSEGILGIGDQGVGGVQIAVGKLAVYTAAAGIHPRRSIPVVLDVGTDNLALLNDDLYLGVRHARVRGERYDAFVERFVSVVRARFPHALIHWEDFGAANAHRILERYRQECLTFNDDIQGTAAVVCAAALAAVRATGTLMSDQRIVVYGAGTAGIGIADLLRDEMIREGLTQEEANRRFWCMGSRGLISEHLGDRMRDFQRPYARTLSEVNAWRGVRPDRVGLPEVMEHVRPTVLIGTSAQARAFSEGIVKRMAAHTERPVIMPLSNPTAKAEAAAADLLRWTGGRALIATGSPFEPIEFNGERFEFAQANNALVFPGLGLGASVCRATRMSDGMIAAASRAVADLADPDGPGRRLLPAMNQLRTVSATVALAVCKAAAREGLATRELENPVQAVIEAMWKPHYLPVRAVPSEDAGIAGD